MAFFSDAVLDGALQVIRDAVTPVLHICSQEPTTYAEAATTYTLGNKSAPTITAQADGSPNGRKVEISTFTDGSVTGTGTGTHWALVDANDNRLLATVAAPASQALTNGNPLSMTSALVFRFPDAA